MSSSDTVKKRINTIKNFGDQLHPSLCNTEITSDGDYIVYRQDYHTPLKMMVDVEGLYDLAHTLQFLEDIGFVHGDINSKNILYTNSGYKLVDYEPDLYQLKNGLKEMRVTVPYIALRDKESGTITSLTDKIGFCYFLMRITGKFTPKDIVDLSKHYNHYKYLNSNEDTLSDMCYLSMIDRYL